MNKLPQIIIDAWKDRIKAPVVTTVDKDGVPNSIYVTCVSIYNQKEILVADNYFDKTYKNLRIGCKGSLLFLTQQGKAYQLKGTLSYEDGGERFDNMKKWNGRGLPGKGVAVLTVEAVYSGAQRIEH